MPQERLETIVSAKITDFDSKMGKVLGTLDSVEKKSGMASKKLDSVLKSKSAGTGKAVEVVNAKLKQTEQAANRVNKVMGNVDLKKFEVAQAKVARVNAQLDAQARKLETLNTQYSAYMSKEKTPASLRAMEREFAATAKEIAGVDAAMAALNTRRQDLQSKLTMSLGSGDSEGVAGARAQLQALELEEQRLLSSTDLLERKSRSLNAQIASIRMDPAASAEAQALAGRIATADARMESLSHSASAAKIELDSMGRTSPGLDAVNRKLGKIERSTGRTSAAMGRLNRRFLMLLASKVFSAIFRSLHEGFEGAAKKSDQFKQSLDAVASGGRNISNGIVAAFAPLINIVAPWVTFVAEKIRVLLNRVSMFFAAIAGQTTVMQATQALDDFGNSAEANAAKAQNALAGFDQITKLDTGAGGSSGSGGSKGTDAFEEVPVVETPLSKAIGGILSKIGELKQPLRDFYKKYLEPVLIWAFDGKGIEGFLESIKKGLEWFNRNPWAVGIVAGLTGLFAASKLVGGLSAISGAAGAIGIGTLSAAALTIAGAAVFAGTIMGLDKIFGTNTIENIAKIESDYGGLFGLINWIMTGETTHVDPATGETYTVPGKGGALLTMEAMGKAISDFFYDFFSGRTLNQQNIKKMDDAQLITEFQKWYDPYVSGTINGDQYAYLEDLTKEIKKRYEADPNWYGQPSYDLSDRGYPSSTSGYDNRAAIVSPEDLYLVERGYITMAQAIQRAEKATNDLAQSSTAGSRLSAEGWGNLTKAVGRTTGAVSKNHHVSVAGTNKIKSATIDLTTTYAGRFVDAGTIASDALGKVGGAGTAANAIIISGATNAGTAIRNAFGGAGTIASNALGEIGGAGTNFRASITGAAGDSLAAMKKFAQDSQGHVEGAAKAISDSLSTIPVSVSGAVGAGIGNVETETSDLEKKWNTLKKNVEESSGVTTATQGAFTVLEAQWNAFKSNVFTSSTTIFDILKNPTFLDGVVGNFRTLGNHIAYLLEGIMTNTQTAMRNIVDQFARLPASVKSQIGVSTAGYSPVSVPGLPRFATGGVFDHPTAGIIAEAGREAVLPLDRNTGWMDRLASKIDGGGGGDVYVTVQNVYDGEVVSEKTTRIQRRTSRIHNRPVLV
ncbi:MAG: hypothetical protein PHP22_09760 [Oscillospiraceae bacterium]|nr:hypothetical protein [Oscillospiraceae bacterium]